MIAAQEGLELGIIARRKDNFSLVNSANAMGSLKVLRAGAVGTPGALFFTKTLNAVGSLMFFSGRTA